MNFMFWQSILFSIYALVSFLLSKFGLQKNREILQRLINKLRNVMISNFSSIGIDNQKIEEISVLSFKEESNNYFFVRLNDKD